MDTPEQQAENKKALKVFGIETVIIVVLIIVILSILSFLNILPFSALFENPKKTTVALNPTPITTKGQYDPTREALIPDPNAPADITVSSQNPLYIVEIENKEEFINTVLKNFPLFGRSFTGKPDSDIRTISVVLADKPGETNKLIDDQGTYASTDIKLENDTMILEQYFAQRVFERYNEEISFIFQASVIFQLYNYAYSMYAPELVNKPDGVPTQINQSLKSQKKNFFIIRKVE